MLVSVIIVSFNTKELTIKAVESVNKYSIKGETELIVVDNNSQDGSPKVLQKYKSSVPYIFIQNKTNTGFAKANNIGINKASGKYIFLLNSDAQLQVGVLQKVVDYADKHADAGVVAPKLLNPDGSSQPSVFKLPTLKRAVTNYWKNTHELDKYIPKTKSPAEVESVVAAAMLITPIALAKVGKLNEKYFMYFEDLDYCRSVNNVGLKVYYLPSVTVLHHHGSSGSRAITERNQWKRLVPSSKIYHGTLKYYLIYVISRLAQLTGVYK